MPDRFADIATVTAKLLTPLAAADRVGIATPERLEGHLPFVRATRSSGSRDRLSDYARIAVDVLDNNYTRGALLAEDIAQFLEGAPHRLDPVVIDRVTVDTSPREVVPWAPGIFRWEALYTVVSRRYRAA